MKTTKRNDKGFTLVELIVVITILAILAAIMVPSCMKYIDKAREKEVLLKARSAMVVSQAEYSDAYGRGVGLDGTVLNSNYGKIVTEILSVAEFKEGSTSLDSSINILEIGTSMKYAAGLSNADMRKAYTITYFGLETTKGNIYYVDGEWVTTKPANYNKYGSVMRITLNANGNNPTIIAAK